MQTKTEKVLSAMNVVAWVVFIGLLVKAGAFLVAYVVTTISPDLAGKLYPGLDFPGLRAYHFWHYTQAVSFMVAIDILKAYTAYLVIRILSKIRLASPFTVEISNLLERISHILLGTWIVVMLSNAHFVWLAKHAPEFLGKQVSGEFIFLAGVVFIFAQVFKKGVEIQSENDLTV